MSSSEAAAAAGKSSQSNPYGSMQPPAEGNNPFYGAAITHPTRRLDSAAPGNRPMSHNYSQQQQQQQQQQQHQHQQQQQLQQQQKECPTGSPKRNTLGGGGGGAIGPAARMLQQHHSIVHPEDSLEYFIKFPTPKFPNEMDAPESDYVFVYKETNVPIVLLLGWAGCQDRYLMKYSKIYEDRGLITVRYTAPVDTLFWKRTAMVPIGEKILKLIYDMNFDSHPLIFHIFSNGGAYLYQHISLAIKKHKTPIQIRGMIFDSAPGDRRMMGLYRAISAIYGKEKKKCHSLTAVFITLTLSIIWFVEEAFTAFKSLFVKTEPVQSNPFNDLKNEPNQFPQMFLYSKGDIVIPHQDVERFVKHRQEHGVEVSSVCFDDAEHVKIYTKYPTQYIHCVCTFINNCLSIPYKGSYATTPTSVGSSSKYD